MAMPKRIVKRGNDGIWFVQHSGQRYALDARAVESKRGWVWVREQQGTPGAVESLLLYDGPNFDARIVGRAEPETRWHTTTTFSEA